MTGALMIDVAGTALLSEDSQLISQPEVGGVILFGRNVANASQVRKLCDTIRDCNPEILIGVDQEGGRVARLREGFTKLPAMGAIGKLFDTDPDTAKSCAFDCGYLMACEVLAVGIDISFAPVLDLDDVSSVIGDRSFHQDPKVIITLANEFMRGMKAAGMATTGKHFPGHGAIAPDSHVSTAIDDRGFAEIMARDIQPFLQTMPLLDALMPAHVIFSQVDDLPAGFSKIWLQDILRDKLGFEGVIFSDDLSMAGAKIAGDIGARVTAALHAGCDLALVCNDRLAALDATQAVKALQLSPSNRVAAMKSQIPTWQGSLEATCQQFSHWQSAKENVTASFFGESQFKGTNQQDKPIDPTHYSAS